jgi:hypothetical protein
MSSSSAATPSLSDATIDQLFELNPALAHCNLRMDKATQKGSAIDVIRMVTSCDVKRASEYLCRLSPELSAKCGQLRINGKGKLTPVADASTLVEIVWELPGKAAKVFRRQSAHLIARYLGADRTLIDEIEARFERVPAAAQAFMQAHVERPEVAPLSDDERMRIRKRKLQDLEDFELDSKIAREINAHAELLQMRETQRVAHQKLMAVERAELGTNPLILALMNADAHIKSVVNDYMKQGLLSLTYTGEATTTELKQHDFCSDFTALSQEMGFGIPSRSRLITMGKVTAKKFREKFGEEPEVTIKYVNGANRPVKTYRLEYLEWVKDRVRETMTA